MHFVFQLGIYIVLFTLFRDLKLKVLVIKVLATVSLNPLGLMKLHRLTFALYTPLGAGKTSQRSITGGADALKVKIAPNHLPLPRVSSVFCAVSEAR